jgi:hypothetical protein
LRKLLSGYRTRGVDLVVSFSRRDRLVAVLLVADVCMT